MPDLDKGQEAVTPAVECDVDRLWKLDGRMDVL